MLLILLALGVAILWIIDLMETLIVVSRLDYTAELNPVARFMLKKSREDFILFKLVDLVVVLTIVFLLKFESERMATSLLMSFLVIYVGVVVHNFKVIKKVSGRKKLNQK